MDEITFIAFHVSGIKGLSDLWRGDSSDSLLICELRLSSVRGNKHRAGFVIFTKVIFSSQFSFVKKPTKILVNGFHSFLLAIISGW